MRRIFHFSFFIFHLKEWFKSPFLTGSLVMVLGTNLYNFGQTVFHLLVGRFLGRAGYADFAAILSALAIVSIVQNSLGTTVVRFVSSGKNKKIVVNFTRWVFYWSLGLGVLVGLVFILLAPFLVDFLHINQPSAFYVLIPTIFLSVILNMARSTLQGLLKFGWYVVNLFFDLGIKLTLMFVLVILGWGVFGAMVAIGISASCVTILAFFSLSEYFVGKRQKAPNVLPLLSYSIPVFFLSLALTSMYSTDVILVKHFFVSEDAGLYASLSKLGGVAFFAAGPVASVMFPLVARSHSRGDPYNKFFYLSVILVLGISLSVVALYKVAPAFVINLLYGSEFVSGAGILWWFGAYMTLVGFAMLLMQFYLSIGLTSIVYPFVAAAALQAVLIWFIHPTLLAVVQLSILSVTLLVGALLVYFPYLKR